MVKPLNERQRSRDNHEGGEEEMERLVILPAAILLGHLLLAAAG
jgi:hypothetical protein